MIDEVLCGKRPYEHIENEAEVLESRKSMRSSEDHDEDLPTLRGPLVSDEERSEARRVYDHDEEDDTDDEEEEEEEEERDGVNEGNGAHVHTEPLSSASALVSSTTTVTQEPSSNAATGGTLGSLFGGKDINNWLWLQRLRGFTPREIVEVVCDELDIDLTMPLPRSPEVQWATLRALLMQAPTRYFRQKLPDVNTIDHVVDLIRSSRRIMVLTGAGISVPCGIPDFRSENGIYSQLGKYNLPDPQCMFDLQFFRQNPVPFFMFSRELLPGSYLPSASHLFIHQLHQQGRLLRNYTQNIDSLELVAGLPSEKVHQCHGSFDTARCLHCNHRYDLDDVREDIESQRVPRCTRCQHPDGVIKPNVVFFGESLGNEFQHLIEHDKVEADLLIVMGSSLKVGPVNRILQWVAPDTPQVLINREVVGQPNKFDVELLGDCDEVVLELTRRLGWELELERAAGGEGLRVKREAGPVFEHNPPHRYYFANAKRPGEQAVVVKEEEVEEGKGESEGSVQQGGEVEEEEDEDDVSGQSLSQELDSHLDSFTTGASSSSSSSDSLETSTTSGVLDEEEDEGEGEEGVHGVHIASSSSELHWVEVAESIFKWPATPTIWGFSSHGLGDEEMDERGWGAHMSS